MNLSFSHIAWPPEDESTALESLRGLEFNRIEVAPVRAFGDPLKATESAVRKRAEWYLERGFTIGSFQALLFGTEGLELFGSTDARGKLRDLLLALARIAGWVGAGPMVFGSPKNRLRGNLKPAEALREAADFFREIGDASAEAGSCLVIEANPEAYGADFCTRLADAAELVSTVGSPGFGLHVDAGGMALSHEEFETVLRQSSHQLRHVHASQPNLGSFAKPDPIHARIAGILHEIRYDGTVAIEMRSQPQAFEAVRQAADAVKKIYHRPD